MALGGTGARTQLRYIEESDFGVIPASGNPTNIRRTDDTFGFKTQSQESNEVRGDRQTTDSVLTGASADGGLPFELSYAEYDPLLEALLQSTWTVYGTNGVSAEISGASVATGNTLSGTGLPVTNLKRGQWVRIATSTPGGANDGKVVQISKSTAPSSTEIAFEGTGLTNGAMPDFVIQSSRLMNDTVAADILQRSFTFEREHSDITKFLTFRGMVVNKLSLSMQSGSIVTGTFEFLGKDQMAIQGTTRLPGTPVASKTYDVMNAVTGIGNIMEGGAAMTGTFIKTLTLNVDNKLRGRDAIGTLGNADIGSGSLAINGNMSVYFANEALYNKFIASERTSFSFSAQDASGNGYVFVLPSVKFSAGDIKAGNKNSDSMVDLTWNALMDPGLAAPASLDSTLMNMIQIYRIGAAV